MVFNMYPEDSCIKIAEENADSRAPPQPIQSES